MPNLIEIIREFILDVVRGPISRETTALAAKQRGFAHTLVDLEQDIFRLQDACVVFASKHTISIVVFNEGNKHTAANIYMTTGSTYETDGTVVSHLGENNGFQVYYCYRSHVEKEAHDTLGVLVPAIQELLA